MSALMIVGFGAGYLVFLAFLLFVVRPKTERRRIQLLVNGAGLPVTADIEPTVVASQRREVRAGYIGIVTGIVIASGGMILAGVSTPAQVFLIDFTCVLVFTGVAVAISTLAREDRRQRNGVRFARLRAVSISDYRSPLDRWMPRIVVVLALASFCLRVILTPGTFGLAKALLYLYAGLMIISLVISEVASRVLLGRGQPAGSALELAWDDALRSRALTAIAVAPFYLGAYFGLASVALYPSTGSAGDALGVQVESVVVVIGAALLLMSAVRSASARPQQRYLRRLWPEFAAANAPVATVPSA